MHFTFVFIYTDKTNQQSYPAFEKCWITIL